jgi:putative hydrolase of the HAD superfamily
MTSTIRAVLFDYGGVVTTSPFEAFARLEAERNLPRDFIRTVNSTNPDTNAWARLERSDLTVEEFGPAFEAEARELGHELNGAEVLGCLAGDIRPEMVEAIRRCREQLRTACLTNNFNTPSGPMGSEPHRFDELFEVVIESRVVGVRKPDPAFYDIACERLSIEPAEAVFLDDLGINLKPARAMGMTTIKVVDAASAIAELEDVVGFPLS